MRPWGLFDGEGITVGTLLVLVGEPKLWKLLFKVVYRDITPMMQNQMQKKMDNDMEKV